MITRRKFNQLAGAALASLPLSGSTAFTSFSTKYKIGVQLFTIPKLVENDLKGTLKMVSEIGYKEVEFFGPYPFSATETIERWKDIAYKLGFAKNAFYGFRLEEVKQMCKDFNLKTPSAHFDLISLRKNMDPAMEAFASLGTKYVVIPTLNNLDERDSADDYRKLADEFSGLGEKMKSYGIKLVYHNHGYEHASMNGEVPLDILLSRCDSRYVKFELDIFWMTAAGVNPVDFLKKYPGKFKLMHVKDAVEPVRFSGDGGTPDQWMALFSKMTDPGKGVFDIKGIIQAARTSGVEHFFLERDLAPDPQATLRNAYQYLSSIK